MTTQEKLIEADRAYWTGKDTGLSDRDFDAMAAAAGYVSQPPATLKGWQRYPDQALMYPNYGLKKVDYETAKKAVLFYPKLDGIFCEVQFFLDKDCRGVNRIVTRGTGTIGKDIASVFPSCQKGIYTSFLENEIVTAGSYELTYRQQDGGRVALCRDLAKGFLKNFVLIPHDAACLASDGYPPRDIPDVISYESFENVPCDGYVVELATGEKFKYKG